MEVAIVSKAKQGFIYRYLKENGITSKGLAGKIGITEQTMCSIINFKWTPTSKRENVAGKKIVIKKLENYFNVPIDELFPPDLTEAILERLSKNHIRYEDVDFVSIGHINPNYLTYETPDRISRENLDKELTKCLAALPSKEEMCLRLRYGIGDGESVVNY